MAAQDGSSATVVTASVLAEAAVLADSAAAVAGLAALVVEVDFAGDRPLSGPIAYGDELDESSPASDTLVLYYPLFGMARSVAIGAPSRDLCKPAVLGVTQPPNRVCEMKTAAGRPQPTGRAPRLDAFSCRVC